jgi:putative oxidoreductase
MNTQLFTALPFAQLLCMLFLAALFIQSGLDKVFDWKGNLDWLKGHFKKTFAAGMVPLLLAVVTILEVSAGFTSLAGALMLFFKNDLQTGIWGAQLAALAILFLFTGQRIAKDYGGAAALVPYFLLCVFSLWLFQL